MQEQVAQTIQVWNDSAGPWVSSGRLYGATEQRERERVYDEGLREIERETRRSTWTRAGRLEAQDRITASFARFSIAALDLQGDAIPMLTDEFLPAGKKLARWARRFDESLSMAEIIQACRNAWIACGLQPLFGESVELTPSILGYSLLYPYSDNFLDCENVSAEEKHRFSQRFRERLRGGRISAQNGRECALWELVQLIEGQYTRECFPQVFDSLLAIHRAQEESIAQVRSGIPCADEEVLRLSCAKGGSSVLADACLARGWLSEQESQFAFQWGALLQLGDDLQDVRDDLQHGSNTVFTRAAVEGCLLDGLASQLLNFSERVGARMDELPHGSATLRVLLRTGWRSLIVGAVADAHELFSEGFLAEMERCSPCRFEFLRSRRGRLTSSEGLYATLFNAFLEETEVADEGLPLPTLVLADV